MAKDNINHKLIETRLLLEDLTESMESENNPSMQLTMKTKILFFVEKNVSCPPSLLINKLNIAKSNLALLCKSLIEEGLMQAHKNEQDKRNVFYVLTQKGKLELEKYYTFLDNKQKNNFTAKELKVFEKKLDELMSLLKVKK